MAIRTKITLLAGALAILALPAAAAAESLIPPGNSAVNQYTESFPTAGGDRNSEKSGKRSPGRVLGAENSRRLQEQGSDGRAAAQVAAETAPGVTLQPRTDPAASGGADSDPAGRADDEARKRPRTTASGVSGSSGLGEVVGQATGSDESGEMGLLLPLVILGAIVGSVVYVLRRDRRAEP